LLAAFFAFIFLITGPSPAGAYSPTFVLGVYGQPLIIGEGDVYTQIGLRINALLSWRTLLSETTSFALYARSSGDFFPKWEEPFYDSHTFSMETLIRGEETRILLEAGFLGSINGTVEGQATYLRPDWRVGFERSLRSNDSVQSGIAYSGYYSHQPTGSDDALFQGLSLRVAVDPSIRFRYGLEILGGWETWTEVERQDLLGSLEVTADGLLGYFQDWSAALQGGIRWSDQEDARNLFLVADAGWAWSPHRQVSLEVAAFAREELYRWPESTPEGYGVFSTGLDFRGDWTPNDRWYLVTELSASRRFAETQLDSRWSVIARGGIEFSF
jgi:hypothetical protein